MTDSSGSVPDEYTSLLPKLADHDPAGNPPENDGESTETTSRGLFLSEFWLLLKSSIPVILAYTLQNSLQTVSVLIIGRSSPENLAVSAFSQMFAMVTAWMIGLGGTTALDTLASSTFTGSSNKHDLGILLQRGFLVLGLFYVPVAILWACSEPVFLFLGQDPQLSRDSARFLTCLIPGGWGIMRAGTYVLLITSPLNAGLNYVFCYTFNIGLLGAPLATGLSYWISFTLLVLYSKLVAGSECWGGWSRDAFQNLGTFARLALLGFVHVGTEWWAFEIVALAAGRLGTIPLAAQSVIMTADQVLNTIPFGIGVATSTRVGNLLGLRNGVAASRAAHTSAVLSMVVGGAVLALLMGTRNHFAKIFNDDAGVVKLTAEVLPYVALFQIADGLNGSCGGSLRGMGRQHVGALVNIVSYYCGALPLGIWLAFHGWGLKGLWVGQCIALYLVGFLEWIIVARSQWEVEVRKAFLRMDVHDSLEAGFET
ncbi:Multi antimicrobial extrusion protein [Penicillium lagena]|uniref:Multi antimicrobial extrusion protein n=1 Tax=Penicillium lagena TaxID=94218 RepID=UPI002542067D|nr:Multi antimicrobial extrusion protein [Penicillium lagena]KAJ5620246.1 Multi antimicrobial extrusion protein [Penicillium lagena]